MPTKYKAGNDVAVTSDDDDHDAGDKIEWDLLLNPSEQLCRVDPLEKLRVEQCHLLGHLASRLRTVSSRSAQQVGFSNIRSDRVLDKIPGSRLGSGRVGVSKYTIGYFRVFWVFQGILGIFGYVWVYPYILRFLSNIY